MTEDRSKQEASVPLHETCTHVSGTVPSTLADDGLLELGERRFQLVRLRRALRCWLVCVVSSHQHIISQMHPGQPSHHDDTHAHKSNNSPILSTNSCSLAFPWVSAIEAMSGSAAPVKNLEAGVTGEPPLKVTADRRGLVGVVIREHGEWAVFIYTM